MTAKRSHHKKKTPARKPAPAPVVPPASQRLSSADFDALELPPVVAVSGDASPSDALAALDVVELTAAPALEVVALEETPAVNTAIAKSLATERMIGVICSGLFDLAALWTSLDELRLDSDEETELGELGGPAFAPYMGEYAKHAPLIAFGFKLSTVVTTKVFIVRALKANATAPTNGNGNGHVSR